MRKKILDFSYLLQLSYLFNHLPEALAIAFSPPPILYSLFLFFSVFFSPFVCSSFHFCHFKSNIIRENAKYHFPLTSGILMSSRTALSLSRISFSHPAFCIPWTITARRKRRIIIMDDDDAWSHLPSLVSITIQAQFFISIWEMH